MDGKDAERGAYRRFRSDSGEGKTVVPLVSTDKMAINRSPALEGSKGRSQMFGLADDANWEADLQDSIDWQFIRTKLANERTFLAWVRTSLTLFSFGYGILKVESYLSPDSVRCQCRQLMATPCRSRTHTHTPRPTRSPLTLPLRRAALVLAIFSAGFLLACASLPPGPCNEALPLSLQTQRAYVADRGAF